MWPIIDPRLRGVYDALSYVCTHKSPSHAQTTFPVPPLPSSSDPHDLLLVQPLRVTTNHTITMTEEYWIAGLAYSPLPGRASPRRRFIKSPFPPLPTSPAQSPPLPSPPMTPNSTTPPPPQRPKSRARHTPVANGHQRQPSNGTGESIQREKRILLRELLPRILATPALEAQPADLSRFSRLQTLALHIFQDPCAFDQDELGRFLAQPIALDALRAFSDAVLDAWARAAPAAIRIPPNSPIRIVDPSAKQDLSNLESSPLELCSAATCACLLWTNMYPEVRGSI
ncbi:hypothetical protein EXIGLDRAFT_214841 [Exidia glandulosa HHB12029]|uniref:Uncharacterized protein n=1 Tax=Exidia glandulosa HHB12029 TaxID=1314781 RepID=A0A165MT97_EXIGL|nr:hypothetical protein EXIGLDRAFT_214841 [Exidia glandulosa HHB12029]